MSTTVISTKNAPAAIGPYSQAIKTAGFVFCSGQLGIDPANGELASGVKAQAERVMSNLKAVAEAAGTSLDHIVKTTIFLTDMANFAVVNEVYGACFKGDKPARSTIAVAALPKAGLVEIEAIFAL
ncbi:MAG: RidA family protein [Spirochaetia bacterium]|jgi:2-iminobutanoate/2-iminopropanoate deaminase|nr:RidA family protein [Spirochaetia bacterium]